MNYSRYIPSMVSMAKKAKKNKVDLLTVTLKMLGANTIEELGARFGVESKSMTYEQQLYALGCLIEGPESCVGLIAESNWINMGKPVWFVSDDVVDLIFNSRFDVSLSDIENTKDMIVAISTRTSIPPFLVSYLSTFSRFSNGSPVIEGKAFMVCFVDNCGELTFAYTGPDTDMDDFLNQEGVYANGFKQDKAALSKMAKLWFGLQCYIRAFPECVHDGFPKEMKLKESKEHKDTSHQITISLSRKVSHNEHGQRVTHWRKGHFRSLRDERYKRNEDGTVKIVWVRDCIVGRGEVKTIDMEESM